jgi:hypothetical protein
VPSIVFRDSFGTTTIPSVAPTLGNWVPDVEEIGDRQTGLGDGTEYLFSFRTDYVASFEMPYIPATAIPDLVRLKRHLLRGGLITIFTEDAASRVFTCALKPGSTPSWTLADRRTREYTLSLAVRNVMPYPMMVDYSRLQGPTANLIVNGGGETGTVGVQAPNWIVETGTNRSTDLLTPTDTTVLFGARSLTRVAVDTTGTNVSVVYQTQTLTVGQRYMLSAWVKTTAIAAGTRSPWRAGAGIAVGQGGIGYALVFRYGALMRTDGLTGYPGAGIIADGTAHDWTFVAALVDLVSTPTSFAFFFVSAMESGQQVWFDDARLVPVPKA